MTALLIHMEGNAERVATAIVDCRIRGIEVLAPDVNRSAVDFSMTDGRILFGLAAIKNVGRHAVESIVAMRQAEGPFKSLEDLCERTSAIQDVNRRGLDALVQSGASDSIGGRPPLLAALDHLTGWVDGVLFPRVCEQAGLLFEPDKVVVVQGKVDARAGSTRGSGAAGSPVEPEMEAEVETASIVAEGAWLWDDPECVPVSRRQLVHVRIPSGDDGLAERLEAGVARPPGTDLAVLHRGAASREDVVHADPAHVL